MVFKSMLNPLSLFGFFTPTGSTEYTIYLIIVWIPFLLFIVYGQKLQGWAIQGDVVRGLARLKADSDRSKAAFTSFLQKMGVALDGQNRVSEMVEMATIMPVNLDPVGVVNKMDHIMSTQNEQIKKDIKNIMSNASDLNRSVASNMLEIVSSINLVYKIVRHYMLISKKSSNNIYLLAQLQMILPIILRQTEALLGAMGALEHGQPIGDGAGPLVTSQLLMGVPKVDFDDETVYGEMDYNNRRIAIVKAKGPTAFVGHVDDALINLLKGPYSDSSAIIMIDAALKLEGEDTGSVAQGIGAAIGGMGVERFKIEEISTANNIPVYAVIVKESLIEAISIMRKEIADSMDETRSTILKLVEEVIPEHGKGIIIGVGNTLGIAQ